MNNICELKCRMKKIKNWDDWYLIENEIFKIRAWKEKELDDFCTEMENRKEFYEDGHLWKPLFDNYDIDANTKYLYEYCREYAFRKLEIEAYNENIINFKKYGKKCAKCDIYTEDYNVSKCPICRKKLLMIRLVMGTVRKPVISIPTQVR